MREMVQKFVAEKFNAVHGAKPCLEFPNWEWVPGGDTAEPLAALAHRPAGDGPLYLETYLAAPIETIVSAAFARPIMRSAIVEIGCLAAAPTLALVQLWCDAAATLSANHSIAVATLTRPLRIIFSRLQIPIVVLAPADPARMLGGIADWGTYYDLDPLVCAGDIGMGADMLAAYSAGQAKR